MDIGILENHTLTQVIQTERYGNDAIDFTLENGEVYSLYHAQDCCEHVYIESIVGDLSDLVGSPISFAREDSNSNTTEYDGDEQWTFYNIGTNKGCVTIRFYGSSNGYYSTSVYFMRVS